MRYTIFAPSVGATTTTESKNRYYVWLNLTSFPEPDSDLFQEESPVYLDSMWTDAPSADARAALLNVHSVYVVYVRPQSPTNVYDQLEWKADTILYQDRKNFVIDGEGALANPNDKRKGGTVISRKGSSGPIAIPLAAEHWEITSDTIKNGVTSAQT